MNLKSSTLNLILITYTTTILLAAALLAPPVFAAGPLVIVAVVIFFRWRQVSPTAALLADYFAFFAVIPLLEPYIGSWGSWLVDLPLLLPVVRDLETAAAPVSHNSPLALRQAQGERFKYGTSSRPRSLTRLGLALPLIALVTLAAGLLMGPYLPLVLGGLTALLCCSALLALARFNIPDLPVQAAAVDLRIVAGTRAVQSVGLASTTPFISRLYLESPYEWLSIDNPVSSSEFRVPSFRSKIINHKSITSPLRFFVTSFLQNDTAGDIPLSLTLTPPLSGPSLITLTGYAVDRWGLTQTRCDVSPVRLNVIPRARYAVWLAQRYLAATGTGNLTLVSNVASRQPLYGYRSGIEYYASRLYEPGDSLKNIDWKHSVKFDKLVSKEFVEFRGQPAVLLVNLAADDPEEADKQAYRLLMTALSLAREQIPGSLAAYDADEVKLVTGTLEPQALVARCIEVAGRIVITGRLKKYLQPADVRRLRANLLRLSHVTGEPSRKLSGLLQIEYSSLREHARANPLSQAMIQAAERNGSQTTMVVLSPLNHDAEAVMFAQIERKNSGSGMIVVGNE